MVTDMCPFDQHLVRWDWLLLPKHFINEKHSKEPGPGGLVQYSQMGLSRCVPSGLAESPQGTCVWSQQVVPPRAVPRTEATCILLSVGCELNSSTRAQGGTGHSLDGPHLHGQPLLGQRLEGKMRPEAAQPPVGTRVCITIVCTPGFLMFLSRCKQASGTRLHHPHGSV